MDQLGKKIQFWTITKNLFDTCDGQEEPQNIKEEANTS